MNVFRELVRFFVQDLVRGDWVTMPDHLRTAAAQLFGLAVAFAAIFPMRILRGTFGYFHSLPDPARYQQFSDLTYHFFLIFIMLVAGLLVAFKWPSLYPAREDHLVLSPLPIARWQIFLAKLSALTIFVGVFVLALATVLALVLPAISSGRWETVSILRRVPAFWISSMMAGFFTFWTLAGLQGVAALLLPARIFRPFTAAVQALLLFALMLAVPFLLQVPSTRFEIPASWFVAVFRQLEGREITAELSSWARLGWTTTLASLLLMLGAYLASYWRYARQMLETASLAKAPLFGGGDGLGGFFWKTLLRSPAHRTLFLGIFGLGLVFVLDSVVSAAYSRRFRGFTLEDGKLYALSMSAAISILYVSIVGLRLIFRLPFEIRARWIFKMFDDPASRIVQLHAVERAYYAITLAPLLSLSLAFKWILFGPAGALRMVALEAALGALLIEIAQKNMANLPFTLPYAPGRGHIIQSFAFYFMGLSFYGLIGGGLIYQALHRIDWALITTVGFATIAYRMRRARLKDSEYQVWLTEEYLSSNLTTLELQT